MAEHANEYLTPGKEVSQGAKSLSAKNMAPIYVTGARECNTTPCGMPRTALSRRVGFEVHAGITRYLVPSSEPTTGRTRTRKRRPHEEAPPPEAYPKPRSYFNSTVAPASSSWVFRPSASSLLTPSRTGFGASSTSALASLRPRPVAARTTLMTWIFLSPADWSTTSNSVCSSSAAAPAPSPAAAPAAGAAATAVAETPKRSSSAFTSSESSRTVMFSIVSINSSLFTAISRPPELIACLRLCAFLFGDLVQRDYQTLDGVVEHRDQPRERGGDASDHLGEQLLAPGEPAEGY